MKGKTRLMKKEKRERKKDRKRESKLGGERREIHKNRKNERGG